MNELQLKFWEMLRHFIDPMPVGPGFASLVGKQSGLAPNGICFLFFLCQRVPGLEALVNAAPWERIPKAI